MVMIWRKMMMKMMMMITVTAAIIIIPWESRQQYDYIVKAIIS